MKSEAAIRREILGKIEVALSKPSWRRVGWRSIRHDRYPKMVVRFGSKGGRGKLLDMTNQEFLRREATEMRDGMKSMKRLMDEANEFWKGQL